MTECNRPETDTEKLNLIREVLDMAYRQTEGWINEDHLGAHLAYLVKAIAEDGWVGWTAKADGDDHTQAALILFREWFPGLHAVWHYIE